MKLKERFPSCEQENSVSVRPDPQSQESQGKPLPDAEVLGKGKGKYEREIPSPNDQTECVNCQQDFELSHHSAVTEQKMT